jgi:hypothetical protein
MKNYEKYFFHFQTFSGDSLTRKFNQFSFNYGFNKRVHFSFLKQFVLFRKCLYEHDLLFFEL